MTETTMTDHDLHDINTERRRARRNARIGPDARCALCGEANPEVLIRVKRTILEAHHIVGLANDVTATVILCRNCHAKVTEKQREFASFEAPESLLDKAIAVLRHLAALFYVVADMMRVLADQLVALLSGLSARYPDWQTMPEAAA
jgi:hypothetical protein